MSENSSPAPKFLNKHLKTIFISFLFIVFSGIVFSIYYFKDYIYSISNLSGIFNFDEETKKDIVTTKVVSEENVVIDVVDKVSDSVVSVVYLEDVFSDSENPIGSGVVIDANGLIVTNKHVVEKEDVAYEVIFQDGKKYKVKDIIRDKAKDLALIKIDASNLTPVSLSDIKKIKLGQKAIAVGNSLGFSNTVSVGIVSGLSREVEIDGEVTKNLIQTDAAINPGNSGGALLNSNGDLVGINTARSEEGDNVGFAIPVNYIAELVEKYQNGKIDRNSVPGFLGVGFVFKDLGEYLKIGVPIGPVITGVLKGSPADKAGLKVGDIIVSIDGTEFSDEVSLSQFIKEKNPGETISIKVYRKNNTLDLNATLIEAVK